MSRIDSAIEKALQQRGVVLKPAADVFIQNNARKTICGWPTSNGQVGNKYIVTVNNPASGISEEYRKLKEYLLKSTRGQDGMNTVLLTSAHPGEGKSITAINLAIVLAQEYDHTVLLIDTNLRNPSCARYLGYESGPGLTDCLLGECDVSQALRKTGLGKLLFMDAGHPVPNPSELFASSIMRDFMEEVKSRYPDRYVVLDAPPVLPFAEARTLASMADNVFLVVRDGVCTLKSIQECLNSLDGARILGFIYNDIDSLALNVA